MYEQSHRDYLRSVICIIVCLSWAVNRHYRDIKCHYLQSPARQNARESSCGTRQLLTCRCVSVMLLRPDAKYTKERADAKAENDALRDDVAAGRRRLHIKEQSVSQCKLPSPPAWIMQPPRLADTAERDYFTLREKDHYAKTTGRNSEVY